MGFIITAFLKIFVCICGDVYVPHMCMLMCEYMYVHAKTCM